MRKRFNLFLTVCSAVVLLTSGVANAQISDGTDPITIELGFATGQTGNRTFFELTETPFTTEVDEDTTGTLDITVEAFTSNQTGAQLLNTSTTLGVDSGNEGTVSGDNTRIDSEQEESITFSFSEDVFLQAIEFEGFVGGIDNADLIIGATTTNILTSQADNGVVDFTDDGMETGFFLAAETPFTIAPGADSRVEFGLNAFTVQTTTAVPEPSSLAVLGMGVVGLIARRRRVA